MEGTESTLQEMGEDTVSQLKAKLVEESAKRLALEEELDLMAFENIQLRNQVHELRAVVVDQDTIPPPSTTSAIAEGGPGPDYSALLLDGDNGFARKPVNQFKNVCGGANVLVSKYLTVEGRDYAICGGVDKTVRCVDVSTGVVLFTKAFSAPVLCISCHLDRIACGMMDGSFAVMQLDGSQQQGRDWLSPDGTWVLKEHTKFVVDIRWSEGGRYLATASHDNSVLLYTWDMSATEGEAASPLHLVTRRRFEVVAESVAFIGGKLLIALRDAYFVLVVNCETLDEHKYSLNGNTWDTHVSFNALYLATSPDQKSFSVSTDNSLHLIFRLENSQRLRTLASHTCGSYGKPKVSWDCTGNYLVSNSEDDFGVHVYSLGSERIVLSGDATIGGHRGQVRDIDCHGTRRSFLSASFDHSVIEWGVDS